MDLKLIENLLKMISESEVNEVAIEEGDFKIKLKKKSAEAASAPQPAYYPPPTLQVPNYAEAPQPAANPSPNNNTTQQETKTEEAAEDNNITIKSPIVGTFYKSPSPDSDAFVNEGDTVSKGDTLCIVEAMKIMNEIDSDYSGKIVKILVDDGQPIEFDQPLFILDPS
ncbi:MAG TPA: acetyl-CoA carboxylase biotin carboxyl carrier protein [Balneolales bacterium]|nr:acetyl-CoA carboxylase biotin carboxyl carrier protein [Balneolales bacterium]